MFCSSVEPFLTTYSTESSDFGNDEIHSVYRLKIQRMMLFGILCKFAEDLVFSWYTMDEVLNE